MRTEGDVLIVADALAGLDEVDYVVITAGSFHLLVEVVCSDDEQLLDVVGRRIRALPGVLSAETFVYLKMRKQTYSWSTKPMRGTG